MADKDMNVPDKNVGDIISRQAAIDAVDVLKRNYPSSCFEDLCKAVDIAIKVLSAQPERKRGKWVDDGGLYRCSNCNHLFSELWWVSNCPIDRMNKIMRYCPNCGADMRKE